MHTPLMAPQYFEDRQLWLEAGHEIAAHYGGDYRQPCGSCDIIIQADTEQRCNEMMALHIAETGD